MMMVRTSVGSTVRVEGGDGDEREIKEVDFSWKIRIFKSLKKYRIINDKFIIHVLTLRTESIDVFSGPLNSTTRSIFYSPSFPFPFFIRDLFRNLLTESTE